MKEWGWMARLAKDGHRFKGGEWRCSDCRRRVLDLLTDRQPCISPSAEGQFLFLGGPLADEWRTVGPTLRRISLPIPQPADLRALPDDAANTGSDPESFTYVLKRKDGKPILAYVYEP